MAQQTPDPSNTVDSRPCCKLRGYRTIEQDILPPGPQLKVKRG